MNKKFIALTSTIALLLAPATTVLADDTEETTPSSENNTNTEVSPHEYTEEELYELFGYEFNKTNFSADKEGLVKISKIPLNYLKFEADNFKLKNIVDGFYAEFIDKPRNFSYTVSFENTALYKAGHTYKVHRCIDDSKKTELEAVEVAAKNGKITVTLHGEGNILIEDLGVTGTTSNGRKAALNTGVK